MSDLLDLHPDDTPGAERPRRRRRPLLALLALLLPLALIGGIAFGGKALLTSLRGGAADYEGAGTGRVVVQVKPGETAGDVATTLATLGVVKSREAFFDLALEDTRSRGIQPGFYALRTQMSARAALTLLLDPKARLRTRVVIPEGTTANQALTIIARSTEVPLAELKAAAANPTNLGVPAYAKNRLEGFLFPATYDVEPGSTALEVLQQMVARYADAATDADLEARAAQMGRTPYEILIVASLIERESRVEEEYGKVSRVVYNRLERKMALGIDATILYGLGRTSGSLKLSELKKDTPYNSRLNRGLPPTPIANPGLAAIEAALSPTPGDWLYYVLADKSGRHLFTASYSEFLRQKEKSLREGVF
ncbi:MAG TPA: endolytic transglycosylase MltG [Mycobacteriales bacterium]|nr:endolytic transglycosylase MltG [Mycobacteriales bacterium]